MMEFFSAQSLTLKESKIATAIHANISSRTTSRCSTASFVATRTVRSALKRQRSFRQVKREVASIVVNTVQNKHSKKEGKFAKSVIASFT